MPRSNRPRRRPVAGRGKGPARGRDQEELDLERVRAGIPRRESAPDGEWAVRTISDRNAVKEYTCPGCSQLIPPGMPHLVAWREDSLFGLESALADRRHWHPHCWRTRGLRFGR